MGFPPVRSAVLGLALLAACIAPTGPRLFSITVLHDTIVATVDCARASEWDLYVNGVRYATTAGPLWFAAAHDSLELAVDPTQTAHELTVIRWSPTIHAYNYAVVEGQVYALPC